MIIQITDSSIFVKRGTVVRQYKKFTTSENRIKAATKNKRITVTSHGVVIYI